MNFVVKTNWLLENPTMDLIILLTWRKQQVAQVLHITRELFRHSSMYVTHFFIICISTIIRIYVVGQ